MPDLNWLIARVTNQPLSLLDLAAVTLIFYWLLSVFRGTRATMLVRGIVILWLASALLSTVFHLTTVTWLVRNSGLALLIGIPILFQPELRRALEQLGRTGAALLRGRHRSTEFVAMIDAVAVACAQLAHQKMGALIVIERETGLQEYADRAVRIDSEVSSKLLVTLFFPNSPLHDGAVIIRGERIIAAGVVLPLTEQFLGPQNYGTRHRAAIGITEHSDAVAVVVSEERGAISVATNGRLVSNLSSDRLRRVLAGLLDVQLSTEEA